MKVVIYGIGQAGKLAYDLIKMHHEVCAFVSSSINAEQIFGVRVFESSSLPYMDFDLVFVASMYVGNILDELRRLGIPVSKIKVYESSRIIIDSELRKTEWLFPNIKNIVNGDTANKKLEIEKYKASCDSYEELIFLANYFCAYGFFDLYMELRNKAQEHVLKEEGAPLLKSKVLLDLGRFQECIAVIENYMNSDIYERDTEEVVVLALAFLLSGNKERYKSLLSKLYHSNDFHYMKILRDKYISIVGPAEFNGGESCSGSSKVDCRINFGFSERSNKVKNNEFVIDYVGAHALNYQRQNSESCAEFVVFESKVHEYAKSVIEKGRGRHTSDKVNVKIFNGFPNFLIRVLIDIYALCDPKEIYLTRFDLYAGEQSYSKVYKESIDRDRFFNKPKNHLLQSQAILHDFISQYRLTLYLYKAGLIKVDDILKKILMAGDSAYLSMLSKKFNN